MADEIDGVDFAVAAFRSEGDWVVAELAHDVLTDVDTVVGALRRFPADGGALAMIGLDEDFFIVARVSQGRTRLMLSDVTAADEWELAGSILERLGLPLPQEEDDSEPAGELDLLDDLGMSGADLAMLVDDMLDDDDLFPDEVLSEVADTIGFGDQFDDAIGFASA